MTCGDGDLRVQEHRSAAECWLADPLVGAELQFLAALHRGYDAGHITWRQLRDCYTTRCRPVDLGLSRS